MARLSDGRQPVATVVTATATAYAPLTAESVPAYLDARPGLRALPG